MIFFSSTNTSICLVGLRKGLVLVLVAGGIGGAGSDN
jgi:hypothetical protein